MHDLTAPVLVLAAVMALASCQSSMKSASPAKPATPATPATPAAAHPPGNHDDPIHNIHNLSDQLISGSAPTTTDAFDLLNNFGVKTIISVDGSAPKVELAAARGMRYVHIPVTYATVTDGQRLEIARAIRDLPGPVFVHCHHGKHRGPAALAAAAVTLGKISNDQAIAFIKDAGTSPHYAGLYESIAAAPVATSDQLDAASNTFPSTRQVHGTTAAMAQIDLAWEHLSAIKAAGWKTPEGNPDLVPAAEAGRLTDNFRICYEDTAYAKAGGGKPHDYVARLGVAMRNASILEESLISGAAPQNLDVAFNAIAGTCKECHGYYRDRVRK